MIGYAEDPSDRWKLAACGLIAGAAAFAVGYAMDGITFKMILVPLFLLMGVGMLLIPYALAIQILFFYLGVEGMLKLLTGYNPVIHVGSDLIVVSLCARIFLRYLLRKVDLPSDRPPLLGVLALHFTWFLVEFANPYSIGLVPSLAGAKVYVVMILLYFFGYYLIDSRRRLHAFMAIWVAVAAIQVVTSLYQSYVGPVSVLSWSPWYARVLQKYEGLAFRPFGTTHSPGAPSEFIFLAVPFTVYFIFQARSILLRLALLALIPGMVMTMLVCQVRVAIFRAIVGTALFVVLGFSQASRRTRMRLIAGVTIVSVALLVALPWMTGKWVEGRSDNAAAIERSMSLFDYDRASQARSGAGYRVWRYATMVPLGAGLSRAGAAAGVFADRLRADPYFPYGFFGDNFWATTIAEIGIPGSLILTTFILLILARGYTRLRGIRDKDLSMLQAVVLSSLAMIVSGLWGNEAIIYNPDSPYFWFFAGALMKLPNLDRRPSPDNAQSGQSP